MRHPFRSILLFSLLFAATASPYSAKRIYFTTDGTASGASLDPTFSFNYFWTGLGMGQNGHVYLAVCDQKQSGPIGGAPPQKGNVCIVKYDPYADQMRSCGTVKHAATAAGNWMANESQEKIHTHLQSMADGRVWMATHDNDGVVPGDPLWYAGLFYRGSHLMYVDVNRGDTLVDHTPSMGWYFKKDSIKPSRMVKGIPASDTSGVAFQFHSIMIIGLNPCNSRYIWLESLPGPANIPRVVVWDCIADTMRTIGYSDQNMREIVVNKQGWAYYVTGGTAWRKTPAGGSRVVGSGLMSGGCMAYSRSYDSAFTITGETGEVTLFDFTRDTAYQIGNLPDGSNIAYRSLAVSPDGKRLYTVGASAHVYEITLATRATADIYTLGTAVSGYYYTMGNMCADTNGNFYVGIHNGRLNGAALLQINLGKDKVGPQIIPTDVAVETASSVGLPGLGNRLLVSPNPARGSLVRIQTGSNGFGPGASLKVYDLRGRCVADLTPSIEKSTEHHITASWVSKGLPAAVYQVVFIGSDRRRLTGKAILIP